MSQIVNPAGAGQNEFRTVRDLLDSQALTSIFGSRAARYKEQFQKIAEKEGILDSDLGDRNVHRKLGGSRALAWNWLGFFLTFGWAAYWRLPFAWYVAGMLLGADALSYVFGRGDPSGLVLALPLIFGFFGNTLLFKEVVKRAHRGEFGRFSPSLPLAFGIPILYAVGSVALMMILAPELLSQM